MPDSVKTKTGNTRMVDGTLSDSWGVVKATWTYHHDDGLNIIFEKK